jgi:cytochrome P450
MTLADVDLTDLDRFTAGFPHETFARLRRDAPVWLHPATAHTPDGEPFWVLSRHADVVRAAADPDAFSSEGGGGRAGGGTILEDLPVGTFAGVLLNMMDAPRHPRVRRLVAPSVAPRMLRAMEPELRRRTRDILDRVAARGACDFLVEVAAELPLQAIARLLGVAQEDRHRLLAWADATLDYADRDLGEQSERSAAAAAAMTAYAVELIGEKRVHPGEDMLSAAIHGRIEGGGGGDDGGGGSLSDAELVMFFHLLVAAGSETTRNALAGGLMALVEHPAELARLRGEPGVMPAAVEEILRWTSPTPYNRRTATRDVALRDATIRCGDKVTLWWASANRDEAVFAAPFRFDVGRQPNPHVAFGHGAHFCLGAALARLEIRVVIEEVLERFDGLQLAGAVEWVRSNKHTGIRHMPLRFEVRR